MKCPELHPLNLEHVHSLNFHLCKCSIPQKWLISHILVEISLQTGRFPQLVGMELHFPQLV